MVQGRRVVSQPAKQTKWKSGRREKDKKCKRQKINQGRLRAASQLRQPASLEGRIVERVKQKDDARTSKKDPAHEPNQPANQSASQDTTDKEDKQRT